MNVSKELVGCEGVRASVQNDVARIRRLLKERISSSAIFTTLSHVCQIYGQTITTKLIIDIFVTYLDDKNTNLRSLSLGTIPFGNQPHTAENIRGKISEVLTSFSVSEVQVRVGSFFTVDCGKNFQKVYMICHILCNVPHIGSLLLY